MWKVFCSSVQRVPVPGKTVKATENKITCLKTEGHSGFAENMVLYLGPASFISETADFNQS